MADSLTLTEAAKKSNNELIMGVVENIVVHDDWFRYLPWVPVDGLVKTITREGGMASAGFAALTASGGTDLSSTTFTAGGSFSNVNIGLATIIGDVVMPAPIIDQLSDSDDQLALQIAMKAKKMAELYMVTVINGVSLTTSLTSSNNGPIGVINRFDGLKKKLDDETSTSDDVFHPFASPGAATQSRDLADDDAGSSRYGRTGRPYSIDDLEEMQDCLTMTPDFIMMNSREIRRFKGMMRALGGVIPIHVMDDGLGRPGKVLSFEGVPVFKNNHISVYEGVNLIASGVFTQASSTTCTVAGSGNLSADVATLAGIAAGTLTLMIRAKSDASTATPGRMYRYSIASASNANPSVLTASATITGYFIDPERGEYAARGAGSAFDHADMDSGTAVGYLYERIDGSEIYAGLWGEGVGLCGFTAAKNAGINFYELGMQSSYFGYHYRLAWYVGFESYSRLAMARIRYILPPS